MPERILFHVDGRAVAAEPGTTVAAALLNAGVGAFRRSAGGALRGPLCAMGICQECRLTLDGVPHRRACMEVCRPGMEVTTDRRPSPPWPPSPASPAPSPGEGGTYGVAVVGAGPAGIAAACRAAAAGARTLVLEEGPGTGGQIYRHRPGTPPPARARVWIERLAASGATVLTGAAVFDAERTADGFLLAAERAGERLAVRCRSLVLATGARELFLPFPGWTLPFVLGAGGAQALLKSGADFRGRTAVVAGSGPLLLPVAAALARAGVRVELVAEQAPPAALARFALALAAHPGKLLDALRYRAALAGSPYLPGTWVAAARGEDAVTAAVLTDGGTRFEVACDLLCVSYGLVPNGELARWLGCRVEARRVVVDRHQATGVPGVWCAGEPCGIGGVDAALAQGEIAGLAAAGALAGHAEAPRLLARRDRERRLAAALDRAFRLRGELRRLAAAGTVVCRCEDVPLGRLDPAWEARQGKLYARAGMGACQGRVCGPALSFLFGWGTDAVRSPLQPTALGNLDHPHNPSIPFPPSRGEGDAPSLSPLSGAGL
jgi:D-hydroxyproline dehydrogenase subunit alpha